MAWSMPSGHGWNPGIPLTPDMSMGSYTPEQWALMQQQNWHQWTQWQQQYAHWQNQYGEEYAQQMHGMPAAPPLPSGAVPPPVPPPDKPPPPPPHENDQPLYGSNEVKESPAVATVKSQQNTQPGYDNGNTTTGNNQNWSYSADSHADKQSTQGVNSEALKVLAEEEKLFDIQFKKWEEEIEKWKKENVNHPDRHAYNEYEQTFESCRAQLLERRQQMKKKRADLMGNASLASTPTNTGNNITKVAPPQLNTTVAKYTPNIQLNDQSNVHNKKKVQNYTNKNKNPPQYQQFNNAAQYGYSRNDNKTIDPQDRYENNTSQHGYMRNDNQTNVSQERYDNNAAQQGYMRNDNKAIAQQDRNDSNAAQQGYMRNDNKPIAPKDRYDSNAAQQGYTRNDNKTIIAPQDRHDNNAKQQDYMVHDNDMIDAQDRYDNNSLQEGYGRNDNESINPQDRFDSYQNFSEEYRSAAPINSTFLPTSKSSKDIPGLDLVPQVEKAIKENIIDITGEQINVQSQQQNPVAPDYSKISKGINNILGDEKIMNILSMVTNQKPPNNNVSNQSGSYLQDASSMQIPGSPNQWDSNNYYNNDYGNQQQNVPYRQQDMNNYQNTPEQGQTNTKFPNQPYQRYNENYDNNRHVQQENYYGRQNQFGNQNMPQRGSQLPTFRPNVPPPRPLIQNVPPPQQNFNDYHDGYDRNQAQQNFKPVNQPVKPKWVDDPLFTPSIIVDYEHKPLRLKARDFIEPVHMFDYNHQSKDGENNSKKDFEKEVDDLFTRKPRTTDSRDDHWSSERYPRDYERKVPRDDFKERSKVQIRDDHDIYNRRIEDRRYDEYNRFRHQEFERRDRGVDTERIRDFGYGRDRELALEKDPERNINRDLERERDLARDWDVRRDREVGRDRDIPRDNGRGRDFGRDRDVARERDYGRDRIPVRDPTRDRIMDKKDSSNRSRSRDRDSRKREHSRENDSNDSFGSKKTKDLKDIIALVKPQHIVMIDDLLEPPGRDMRPQKIVIILRGPPGSGKSYLAKLIRDKEAERGVTVRVMSIDDYFMQESEIEEKDPTTGKIIKKPSLKYEYDDKQEESYINSLKRAFKRTITDGYFTFLIYDAINDQLKSYADIWNFARQNGFQGYICTMELDSQVCFKRNIHNRTLEDIEVITSRFFPTPAHHIQLDATTLLQSASIREVQMEDVEDVTMEDAEVVEVDSSFTSKWEKMDDAAQLARLDGTSKPLRSSQLSMEDYLQLDDWKPNVAKPGKKTVRWADLEERRQQEKMRAIGFVVGQTDWNRMTDPTMGSSALTQTKYIERVRRS